MAGWRFSLKDLMLFVGSLCLLLACLVFWFSSEGVVAAGLEFVSGFGMGCRFELGPDDFFLGHHTEYTPSVGYIVHVESITGFWCWIGGMLGVLSRIVIQTGSILLAGWLVTRSAGQVFRRP